MRDNTKTTARFLLSLSCACALGCAAEIEDSANGDLAARALADSDPIGVSEQALSGKGSTFWIPARGEHSLTIYYCFENLSEMVYGRNSVAFALNNTWKKHANI